MPFYDRWLKMKLHSIHIFFKWGKLVWNGIWEQSVDEI